jgi:hypothetical protein
LSHQRLLLLFPHLTQSNLTPGISRAQTSAEAFKLSDDIHAGAGRVHAVVRWRP